MEKIEKRIQELDTVVEAYHLEEVINNMDGRELTDEVIYECLADSDEEDVENLDKSYLETLKLLAENSATVGFLQEIEEIKDYKRIIVYSENDCCSSDPDVYIFATDLEYQVFNKAVTMCGEAL